MSYNLKNDNGQLNTTAISVPVPTENQNCFLYVISKITLIKNIKSSESLIHCRTNPHDALKVNSVASPTLNANVKEVECE